jgi:hypothetical protein
MKIAKAIVILYFLGTTNPLEGQEANPYLKIAERNAFELTAEQPKLILPPAAEILKPNLYLTGITHFKGVRKVHLVLKRAGEPNKFVSLAINTKQYNIELKKINKNTVLISNNGHNELLSFENNSLPTIISKAAPPKRESSSKSSRDRKESSKKQEKKSTPAPARPHIVQVPSRRPQIDPRIIEKGLEYLSKTDDQEKREHIAKRLESLQSGQHEIKSDMNQNERRRQYDEWKKRREAAK